MANDFKEKKSVLIIYTTNSLGDLILATPLAKALWQTNNDLLVGWCVHQNNKAVLKGNPYISSIFTWNHTFRELINVVKQLRSNYWHFCLDLRGLLITSLLARLAKCRNIFGLETPECPVEWGTRLFYSSIIYLPMLHEAELHWLAGYTLGEKIKTNGPYPKMIKGQEAAYIPKELARPTIYLTPTEIEKAEKMLGGNYPFIALCPTTTTMRKMWPPRRWGILANEISRKGYLPVFVGSKKDLLDFEAIKEQMYCPYLNLIGKTTIREAAAIFTKASLVISVDSGAMHLAVASGARVLALFGPASPERWGPYGGEHKSIYKNLPCSSPCVNEQCLTIDCMRAISVEEVLKEVETML